MLTILYRILKAAKQVKKYSKYQGKKKSGIRKANQIDQEKKKKKNLPVSELMTATQKSFSYKINHLCQMRSKLDQKRGLRVLGEIKKT